MGTKQKTSLKVIKMVIIPELHIAANIWLPVKNTQASRIYKAVVAFTRFSTNVSHVALLNKWQNYMIF